MYMGIYAIKPKFQKVLTPVKDFFVRHRIGPTTINVWGLIFSLLMGFALYYSYENKWLLIAVPVLAFIRTAFNALDGLVSRELGVASRFGEVLNELIDRISDAAIFIGLALSPYADFTLGSIVVIVILLNSYLSILSKAAGASRQYGGFMGKADRMFYLGLAAIIVLAWGYTAAWNYLFWFMLAGTVLTLCQRFMATKRELAEEHAKS